MSAPRADWCVVYREGTREAFAWKRTQAMTLDQAREAVDRHEHAHVATFEQSLNIGLPEGWTYEEWLTSR